MVDQWTGKWTEEKDYSTYPKEKWCDYDRMAVWIRNQGYEPKTSMENLIANIFAICDESYDGFNLDEVKNYVSGSGLSEFDYIP